ncbi:MAG: hypothetical protein M3Y41_19685 [Pseudomonadota bacterium]|nr:hypothetical protein [Pseudomonadota bacterium]
MADITFVPRANGFLYLAVVLDTWSRKVVGWSMANHLRPGWWSTRSRWRSDSSGRAASFITATREDPMTVDDSRL